MFESDTRTLSLIFVQCFFTVLQQAHASLFWREGEQVDCGWSVQFTNEPAEHMLKFPYGIDVHQKQSVGGRSVVIRTLYDVDDWKTKSRFFNNIKFKFVKEKHNFPEVLFQLI